MERKVKELTKLLETIASVTGAIAREGMDLFPPENHRNCHPVMEINSRSRELLRDPNKDSAEWVDEAIRFLYSEVLAPGQDGIGLTKYWILPENAYPEKRERCEELLQPLKELLYQESNLRSKYELERPTCVILTALPVEFRAFIRRAKLFLRGSPLMSVGRVLKKSEDEDKVNRKPCWLECTLDNGKKWAKVAVIFPKEDGSLSSQKAIYDYMMEHSSLFKHVIVLGVAGWLGNTKVGMGDVVISRGFYDSHRRKVVSESPGEIYIDFSKKEHTNFDIKCPFDFTWDKWRPTEIFESNPEPEKPGFQQVEPGYVVSGPEVVKSEEYRGIIHRNWPNALAVEMEAAGCYWAVKDKNIPVTIIKGICDWSDHRKSNLWQPYCAEYASAFAVDYILALYGSEKTMISENHF